MCSRRNNCMARTIFRMFFQFLHVCTHSYRRMRVHYITIGVVHLFNDSFCFFIINVGTCEISFNTTELFFVDSQFTCCFKIFHPTSGTFTIFTRDIVQETFKVGGFKNIHGRRNRCIEWAVHIVCASFKEISKHIVLVGCTNQFTNRNTHFFSIVSS